MLYCWYLWINLDINNILKMERNIAITDDTLEHPTRESVRNNT